MTMTRPTRTAEEQRRRDQERNAPPPTDDHRSILVGMDRPATPDELRAFIDREQARIRAERGLTAVANSATP